MKTIKFLVCLLLFAATTSVGVINAQTSGTCGPNLTWTLSNGTLTIKGTGVMDNYTSSTCLWYNNYSISKIIIKEGVTSIGNHAFSHCKGLTSLVIPNSVTRIGEYACSNCSGSFAN